jgi:hypothetical protein
MGKYLLLSIDGIDLVFLPRTSEKGMPDLDTFMW